MIPSNLAALAFTASFLSGCAHCHVASYYKPFPDGSSQIRTFSQNPGYVELSASNKASILTFVCGGHHLPPPGDTFQLCLAVELAPDSTMRFLGDALQVTAEGAAASDMRISGIEYDISCWIDRAGARICSSPEASPVDGPRQKLVAPLGADRYVFDSLLEFRGAADALHQGQVFGNQLVGKRRYLARTVPITINKYSKVAVRLPDVLIDGQRIRLPSLKFQAVTEEVCRLPSG